MPILWYILYLILSSSGIILIRLGGSGSSFSISNGVMDLQISGFTILGLMSYLCSFFLYIYLIQRSEVSHFIPLAAGIGTMMAVVLARLVLKEAITLPQWIGIALVVIGITCMSIRK